MKKRAEPQVAMQLAAPSKRPDYEIVPIGERVTIRGGPKAIVEAVNITGIGMSYGLMWWSDNVRQAAWFARSEFETDRPYTPMVVEAVEQSVARPPTPKDAP